MHLSFEGNLKAFERGLSDLALRQMPFATSIAINETIAVIQKNAAKALGERVAKPTPFTRRGLAILRSSRRNLEGVVLYKDAQAAYLKWLEDGGTREPKRRAIPVPVGIRLNAYGNMGKGAVRRASVRPDVFSGSPGGGRLPAGIWQRTPKRGLKLLVRLAGAAEYQPGLNFKRDAEITARKYFPIAFDRAFRRAMATARP